MSVIALILDFAILVFSFGAMHFISERYFIESLDYLSKKLRLSSDMAGSTLMAAGSSAPELAVALFSILMAGHHEAIGVGTIVGSALFNILVISGAVMYISRTARLVWQPIVRDIIFYILAILLLGYTFHEEGINLFTGILLVSAYIIYVIFVYFWKRVSYYDDTEDEPEKKHISKPLLLDRLASRYQVLTFFISYSNTYLSSI